MDDKPGRILITIDCEERPPVADGRVGDDRMIEFRVEGKEGSYAEIFNLPIRGEWLPWMPERLTDIEYAPYVRDRTICAGQTATLHVLEDNHIEFSVRYNVRCVCPDGDWYPARAQNPPPRMIIGKSPRT